MYSTQELVHAVVKKVLERINELAWISNFLAKMSQQYLSIENKSLDASIHLEAWSNKVVCTYLLHGYICFPPQLLFKEQLETHFSYFSIIFVYNIKEKNFYLIFSYLTSMWLIIPLLKSPCLIRWDFVVSPPCGVDEVVIWYFIILSLSKLTAV